MQTFVRRALAASAAGVCLAAAGAFTVPAAVAAIQQMSADPDTQSYVLSSSASRLAKLDATDVTRDDYLVSHFSVVQYPVPPSTGITSFFGYRSCAGCSTHHSGIDFTPGAGAAIASVADGVVVPNGPSDGSLGVHITIQHDIDGVTYRTIYAHMISGSPTVAVGDTVARGQVIGLVGSTGQSMGPHLHFSVENGAGTLLNPLTWLREHVNADNL